LASAALVLSFAVISTAQTAHYRLTEPLGNTVLNDPSDVQVSWIVDLFATDRQARFHHWLATATVTADRRIALSRPVFHIESPYGTTHVSVEDTLKYHRPDKTLAIILLRVNERTCPESGGKRKMA
jgi:hypothetical protein